MFFQHRAFRLAKDVRQSDQYEDAFAVDEVGGIAAIADGVSSSFSSSSWARLLVQGAVSDPPDVGDAGSLGTWLARLRKRWSESIHAESLAWHQKAKLREGALATLLWIRLEFAEGDDPEATGPIRLLACALGDCCLFHVRDDQTLRAFPMEDSRLFARDPVAVGSVDRGQDDRLAFDTLDDFCRPGDLLVLCTDAVAAWALGRLEAGRSPEWQSHWEMSQEAWGHKISELRRENRIRYDDSTLVMLRLGSRMQGLGRGARRTSWIDDMKKTVDDVAKTLKKTPTWDWVEGALRGKRRPKKNDDPTKG